VWFLRYARRRVVQGEGSKLNRVALLYAVLFFFLLEAYVMGVVVQNFLVPLLSPSLTLLVIQYGVTFAYFVSVSFLYSNRNETVHKSLNSRVVQNNACICVRKEKSDKKRKKRISIIDKFYYLKHLILIEARMIKCVP